MASLVTGGAGFVAATLIQRLLDQGEVVLALDNFTRGRPENLGPSLQNANLVLQHCDVADLNATRAAVAEHFHLGHFSSVWHLAANSDIPAGIADAKVDLKDTFMTTFVVVQIMKDFGIGTLYFASSSAIYGDLGTRLITEDIGPLFPISNYGAMKLASEALITAAAEGFLQQAFLFRFPNVVGVPATHGVLLDFIRRLKDNSSCLQVLGDGTQQKVYLHVSDLVDAMLWVGAKSPNKVEAVNIGPIDEGVTVRQIAEETVAHVAPRAELRFGEGNKGWVGDVPRFRYSTERLRQLGWQPQLDSLGAIRRSIQEIALQESSECARPLF